MSSGVIDPFAPDLLDLFVDPDTIEASFYPGLYIFFQNEIPIYIGQSQNVAQRLKEHRQKKWHSVANSVKVLPLADRDTRLCVEAVLQLRYRPRFCRAIKLSIANDGHLTEIQFLRGSR